MKTVLLSLTAVVVLGGIVYAATNAPTSTTASPTPMTMGECRAAVRADPELAARARAYANDADTVIEMAAIQCYIDHNADTYSWSMHEKWSLAAYRICAWKAEKEAEMFGFEGNEAFQRARQH